MSSTSCEQPMKGLSLTNYQVVLLEAVRSFDQLYTYSSTTPLRIGERVLVPFGPKDDPKEGVVFDTTGVVAPVKPIIRRLDAPMLPEALLGMLQWAMDYYVAPIGALVGLALPKALRYTSRLDYVILDETLDEVHQEAILAGSLSGKELQQLIAEGRIRRNYASEPKPIPMIRQLKRTDETLLRAFQSDLPKRNRILHRTIESLLIEDQIPLEKAMNRSHLKLLLSSGAVELIHHPDEPTSRSQHIDIHLTQEQRLIANHLSAGQHLIYGVPASGKTTILMHEVRRCIQKGKQALLLVPEQLMAEHLARQLETIFSEPITTLHGRLSDGEIRRCHHHIRTGQSRIIVGTRNALLAPFQELGFIGLDDFHDDAFVSDDPAVDFRKMAMDYATRLRIPLILSSSTPDLQFLSEPTLEKHFLDVPYQSWEREYHLIDLRQEVLRDVDGRLSRSLREALDHKCLLFLNRIGYSGFVVCRSCGEVMTCPTCHQPMLYHQSTNRLLCRQCGVAQPMPKVCPHCQGEDFEFAGMGLEKLAELLERMYPDKSIERFDSYSLRKKSDLTGLTERMAQADILLASQILTKGYEIPGLEVVGLLSPDTVLYTPEYRGREKCFQNLIQVAARVGRTAPGQVFIQTYTPEHDVYQKAIRQDIRGFYRQEYQLRKLHGLPPLRHMIKLVVSHPDQESARAYAQRLADLLSGRFDYSIQGPYLGIFEKISGFFRYHLIIKDETTMDDLKAFLRQHQPRGQVRLHVVVDPLSLLY